MDIVSGRTLPSRGDLRWRCDICEIELVSIVQNIV